MSSDLSAARGEVVRCARLVKIYPSPSGETHALRGVEVALSGGTVTAVTGPSGSGKSSLLAILGLRERQSGGELWLSGADVATLRPGALRRVRRRGVGFVAQRSTANLYPHLGVAEQVEQVTRLRGVPAQQGAEVLERLGLASRARARTSELSGGEQQRLGVAVAVVGAPALVVADEPTAELDDVSADLVLAELRVCAAAGSAVVLSTHDARATRSADRVLALRHGVLSGERDRAGLSTAAIDATGRVQLPPEALAVLPRGRAVVVVRDGSVLLLPPPPEQR